ncbi:MAG: glucokinase [Zoogloeaceae bacterium]|nr:glucokinase [Rhodocyclaceae bacterium]MCP5237711.1 glucokinase [Zoogloeaceae bacterium]
MSDHYPHLVGDVGGTHARFAVVESPGRRPVRVRVFRCAEFAGPDDAIRAYLRREGLAMPRHGAIGIATPVTGDDIALTNGHWRFAVSTLRAALGLERLVVVNDFTALALGLLSLEAGECIQLGGGAPTVDAAIALIGAGTGLGVSGLVRCGNGVAAITGEGGHVTLSAGSARESAIIDRLARRFGHVSAERTLSGPGLSAMHDAIRELAGQSPSPLPPERISARALAGDCPHCIETIEIFCELLGSFAADVALTLGARGGVYLGGGIVPRLGEHFLRSGFRHRFDAKGRFSAYLAKIPVFVLQAPHVALAGAARLLTLADVPGQESRAAPMHDD